MFSRNGRTYLTAPAQETKYAGNRPKGGQNGGKTPRGQSKADSLKSQDFSTIPNDFVTTRFPNHAIEKIYHSAKSIR
jgi:hypothetical protein